MRFCALPAPLCARPLPVQPNFRARPLVATEGTQEFGFWEKWEFAIPTTEKNLCETEGTQEFQPLNFHLRALSIMNYEL